MDSRGLMVGVDLRSHQNNLAHRTREMDGERLVVRRGQPFSVAVRWRRALPPRHYLDLVLHLGVKNEQVVKVQTERGAGDEWWFQQQGVQEEVLLTLHSPADAAIGHYRLAVLVMSPGGHMVEQVGRHFHLLFNPWCKDDAVYLPEESLLQEYIMNEDGIIYTGSWDYIHSLPWNYGQFEDRVLDICFQVLDNSKKALKNSLKDLSRRCDPVYIGRTITAMVNANDDRGVLAGRWTEPFSDGVSPSRWTGSVPVLRQWSQSGTRAVKYGQCWVFAGVTCTVLRCLGIPARVITNFNSAHDVDGNLAVDVVLDASLESSGSSREDSKWNFHCWVEAWMKREDLPPGHDGWQVLDPTPQERSEGEFCCGPCPVAAIKEGNLGVKYDAPFVFAEVNADIVHWITYADGRRQKIREDQGNVGRNISTKSVFGDAREDVTRLYKYPEGSRKEREVYVKAGRRLTEPGGEQTPEPLQLSIKHATPVFGTDFDVMVEVENVQGSGAGGQLTVLAKAVTYNALFRGECKRRSVGVHVHAHAVHREVLRLRYADYATCVSEHHLIRVEAFLTPTGRRPVMAVANISLSSPELLVQVPGKAVVWESVSAHISFANPLPVPLRGGVFTVEGAGLLPATQVQVKDSVAPGQKLSVTLSFSPMRTGVRRLLVDFDSDRLKDVKGVTTVVVHKQPPQMASRD
ncbi:protein-glutamine gamma-glutamyltransferase 2 isoform X2 [Takifugu rubripes]|uniref:protein-glutamine gamma-glutamyltransferase n=1 Tax=Takifugu rubripes TaxID=31033 RepID=H2RQS4_TAKRU|nr:protein-glutamine gamma-glutamyltransferase 2-like isoform X2 [Takifugu rubripes]